MVPSSTLKEAKHDNRRPKFKRSVGEWTDNLLCPWYPVDGELDAVEKGNFFAQP
jgi:hypothetical protein